MKKVGIYICNYNKCEYVMRCVESLLKQTFREMDIYVVDNASEDNSVKMLETNFNGKITIIKNDKNLGGSGGFNVGLRDAMQKNYKYVVLVDNDVWVDSDTIQNMYNYMELHTDIGILGPEILRMDKPEMIQDLGGSINEKYNMEGNYSGKSNIELPKELDCTYISTCTAMARIDAVRKFGLMPEENFIYWDDVEWSKKCQLHGYRTVAISTSKVWHNHSIITGEKTNFVKYYLTRNKLHFFAKYVMEEDMDKFVEKMLSNIFSQLYGFYNKGSIELFQTVMYAFDDFIHGIRGKASDFKIMRISEEKTPFQKLIIGKNHVRIFFTNNYLQKDPMDIFHVFLYIIANIQDQNPQKKLWISLENCDYSIDEFYVRLKKVIDSDKPKYPMPEILISNNNIDTYDLELRMCEHVNLVTKSVLPQIYVDRYCNCITSDYDYKFFQSYFISEKLFKEMYRPIMKKTIKRIRENERADNNY